MEEWREEREVLKMNRQFSKDELSMSNKHKQMFDPISHQRSIN